MVMMNNLKKFYSILSEDHKKKLIYIIIFSFIGALLEMISLGLIIPIIGFLNSETLVNNYFINSFKTKRLSKRNLRIKVLFIYK
jgi:ABC-type multidrug transport system fused ATPase/permease subunit